MIGNTISIGELAKRTGCNIETIRYYERIGVLPKPPRSEGGQRRYAERHVQRLNFIRRGRELGFTLAQVRTLLDLADERGDTCAEVEAIARAHLVEIRDKIADLKVMERVLADMAALCATGTVPECPIIEALYEGRAKAKRY